MASIDPSGGNSDLVILGKQSRHLEAVDAILTMYWPGWEVAETETRPGASLSALCGQFRTSLPRQLMPLRAQTPQRKAIAGGRHELAPFAPAAVDGTTGPRLSQRKLHESVIRSQSLARLRNLKGLAVVLHGVGGEALQPGIIGWQQASHRAGPPRSVVVAAVRDLGGSDTGALTQVSAHGELGVEVVSWGLGVEPFAGRRAVRLSQTSRRGERDLNDHALREGLSGDRSVFAEMMPPFGAAQLSSDGSLTAVTDYLGARHLYFGSRSGTAMLSTSSNLIARCLGSDLDLEALAIQSLLGWQLGSRTNFVNVSRLPAGCSARLTSSSVTTERYCDQDLPPESSLDQAVRDAAEMIRMFVESYVEDHPDAILQLTGGLDSRVLLSAIPVSQRRGLRTMTLRVSGNEDADIARQLSRQYGMHHEEMTVDVLYELTPADAFERCVASARRLGCEADPLADAALSMAEETADLRGPRLSGLGGEVARGFYYVGPALEVPVTQMATRVLAAWRMLSNEAVDEDALDQDFARWAHDFIDRELFGILRATGTSWFRATDELYLWERMQNWAGATETAVCMQRSVVNPMLDGRFIRLARSLSPAHKRGARFLSSLQYELDEDLARVRLDGRPAPIAYMRRSPSNTLRRSRYSAEKARRKVMQRVRGTRCPPVGGEILAQKVVQHWRSVPQLVEPVASSGLLRAAWLERMLMGLEEPSVGTVSFMVNLLVAESDRRVAAQS